MASNINYTDINELYPVAGQDNDSQGFRDNFNTIKAGLQTASTEISTLQTKTTGLNVEAYTKGSLEGADFLGDVIAKANFTETTEEPFISDSIESSTYTVDWTNGHYQIITLNDTVLTGSGITVTLADNWPASGKMGRVRIGFRVADSQSVTVTLSAGGGNALKKNGFAGPSPALSVSSDQDPYFIDAWTTNSGSTVYVHALGLFE